MTVERTTKYVSAIRLLMQQFGHATNAQLLAALHESYPDVSATTVHRITTRLQERDEIRLAPPTADNAQRYDANTLPHDHFQCTQCGQLRDADIRDTILPIVESAIGDGCSISGRLVISGLCKQCNGGLS
jgi:Fe2+ or Zn2+ uptake regulation protein